VIRRPAAMGIPLSSVRPGQIQIHAVVHLDNAPVPLSMLKSANSPRPNVLRRRALPKPCLSAALHSSDTLH
jgi:hypothetical protein